MPKLAKLATPRTPRIPRIQSLQHQERTWARGGQGMVHVLNPEQHSPEHILHDVPGQVRGRQGVCCRDGSLDQEGLVRGVVRSGDCDADALQCAREERFLHARAASARAVIACALSLHLLCRWRRPVFRPSPLADWIGSGPARILALQRCTAVQQWRILGYSSLAAPCQ